MKKDKGGRPPLSLTEPTVFYGIKLPKSLEKWCKSQGAYKVRYVLERYKKWQDNGYK